MEAAVPLRRRLAAGVSPATISAIAIAATLNTVLAQMTMAARVVYWLAREHELPAILARAHRRTGTPLVATVCIAATVVPLTPLAEATSLATLAVFALVNLALLCLRYRGVRSDNPHVTVPIWIPQSDL
ncbi:amino acid permease [Bradyrhizobium sp.]|uniref:amino acid permease n=1 Tax=Bradyrhizobium sp. TaxID=376 RepID=UPI0025C1DCF3|nr:amino acid permease [Bradyrhizobium sp.]